MGTKHTTNRKQRPTDTQRRCKAGYQSTHASTIYDVAGASERLVVGMDTVRNLCRTGRLPAAKVANQWRILGQSIIDFAAGIQPIQLDQPEETGGEA